MGDADAQMRPTGPPRPPFPAGMPMRPMAGPPRPMPPNMIRPPPLRQTDSQGNLLMGQRPPMPQQPNIQMRPPSSGGPISPPGQGPPRPGAPWTGPPPGQANPNRPQNPYPGNPPARPPFQRPPIPQGQQQFRPPIPQQQQQQHMPPTQQLQQQQQQQQAQQHHQLQQQQSQRPPSTSSINNEDDDDVIMGQAVTPLKSLNLRDDLLGPSLFEETEPPTSKEVSDTTTRTNSFLPTVNEINDNIMKPTNPQIRPSSNSSERTMKSSVYKGDNDSGVDESTQEKVSIS
ncbi:proline-rich protein HaeIII subfamily 1-like [Teleopsis dalmanni]|uniref:proline-rich protein HaeIII subfamily 1-like n=1 Tax=Teleopsis dalmanni TaxID=139649 RepID=UPI0018CD3EA7|nr:proline-rich protein HaeIII subfamily 1-like [Teleopsis dalmanni]